MKLESGKGKWIRKTLKTWGSHYYTIHTDISLGQTDWVKNGGNGTPYWTYMNMWPGHSSFHRKWKWKLGVLNHYRPLQTKKNEFWREWNRPMGFQVNIWLMPG
jgi:hypothetical protein